MLNRRQMMMAMAALPAATTRSWAAEADNYPSRMVRIITGSASSSSDQIARYAAFKLSPRLGQSFIIENRAGAGGTIGTAEVAKSPPDGYTLTIAHLSTHVSPTVIYPNLSYDPTADFAPISLLMESPLVLVVHPSVPANSLEELMALAQSRKDNPLTWSSAGSGSLGQLTGELFTQHAKTNFLHVPYRGGGPALLAVVTGEVMFTFASPINAQAQVAGKMVKALAVSSRQRFPILPDTPGLDELGHPEMEAILWQGIMAPSKTPPAIIAKLNREIRSCFDTPETREELMKQGAVVKTSSPEEFRAFLKSELEKWTPVIKAANIKPE
ncbi:Bug family tripartite tricarboxylate transporter substrate binding protein [Pseudochelatococcus lubricantis]|uniref:Bug family tripartite tricarboxylate transporter substrate binding protein n=1 Tax=Pseudochelatococcus lubricantis TaxID=1538102 RepID=UPI0035EE3AC1